MKSGKHPKYMRKAGLASREAAGLSSVGGGSTREAPRGFPRRAFPFRNYPSPEIGEGGTGLTI